jgi:hypothetical protein
MLNARLVAAGPVRTAFTHDNLRIAYGGRLTVMERAGEVLRQGRPESPS